MEHSHDARCAGCHQTFKSYNMTPEEGFKVDGKVYCNDDCFHESEVYAAEMADWRELGEEY